MRNGSESRNAGWGILLLFGVAAFFSALAHFGIMLFGGSP